jgi:hypothetical protein
MPPGFGSLWLENANIPQAANKSAAAPNHLFQFRHRD